jgi:hypothetical protein
MADRAWQTYKKQMQEKQTKPCNKKKGDCSKKTDV